MQTMLKLNPYAAVVKRAGILRERRQLRVKAQKLAKKNKVCAFSGDDRDGLLYYN